MSTHTLESLIRHIKKQAKKLKEAAGISHCQALEALARQHGFNSFIALTSAARKEQGGGK